MKQVNGNNALMGDSREWEYAGGGHLFFSDKHFFVI